MTESIANTSDGFLSNPDTETLTASNSTPCPLCQKTDWCFLIKDQKETFKVICGRTQDAPNGWTLTGIAKDNRNIFTRVGRERRRFHLPNTVNLTPTEKTDIPKWSRVFRTLDTLKIGDLVRSKVGISPSQLKKITPAQGDGHGQRAIIGPWQYDNVGQQEVFLSEVVAIHTDDAQGIEQYIEYFYPCSKTEKPLGKVHRQQWSDRRKVYSDNRKTKLVLPYHWLPDYDEWKLGKGSIPWPLYREQETLEAIGNGGIVFLVGGEQAVECYRSLGLTATCSAGGEGRWKDVLDTLQPAIEDALSSARNKPLIVIHPDHDICGETQFAQNCLDACRRRKLPAVSLNPLQLWGDMPHKGDIKDWMDSGISPDTLLRTLETCIYEELDNAEREIEGRVQRALWKAPESHNGELGYWKGKKESDARTFYPLTDFDFQIERELASADGGGLLLQLKRADDRGQRRVFLRNTDYSSAAKFVDAIKRSLFTGVVCALSTAQVQALMRVRQHEYRISRGGKTFRLVDRVGQQPDGHWIFPNLQLDPMGTITTEEKSLYCWHTATGEGETNLPCPKLLPPDPNALKTLLEVMRQAFGPVNIHHAILTLGYAAAAVHYQAIMEVDGCFPILNNYGDAHSGKTSMADCALAIVGMNEEGMVQDISVPAIFEKLKITSSLLYCLDDPKRSPELDDWIKSLYNGKGRIVKGNDNSGFNTQKPHSALMLTSNSALGETSLAARTRMIRLFVGKRSDGDPAAFQELLALQKRSSGALQTLIRFGHPRDQIAALESTFRQHMPYANGRIPKSLALITTYADLICKECEQTDINIVQWVVENVCPDGNTVEESGDSLRDFFEKLAALQSISKIGDWNLRVVREHNSNRPKGVALYMASAWPELDREYSLSYNQDIIKKLLSEEGCDLRSSQKFDADRDQSIAYARGGSKKPDKKPRTCILIPIAVVKKYSSFVMTEMTEMTEDEKKTEDNDAEGIRQSSLFNNNKMTEIESDDWASTPPPQSSPSPTPVITPVITSEMTDEANPHQGIQPQNSPSHLSHHKKGANSQKKKEDEWEWIACDSNHKPPVGAHVRIIAGKQKGQTATVVRVHAVQAGVKLSDGINTLEDLNSLEMRLDGDGFIGINSHLFKVVERGNKWLKVVKGDRGRKRYGYNLDTKELKELKNNANG